MISFKKFLLKEELNDEQKQHVSNWYRDPEAHKHTDHYFGKGNDERVEELHDNVNKSEIHKAIERHLGQEIHPNDYKQGHTFDKYNRRIRIGALLQKTKAPNELMNDFANDSTRQYKSKSGLFVRTTRSAAGVAGQTSGSQPWAQQSCKNFDTGSNKHYLPREVEHGTVVSYLHDHTGKELARATFHPHINDMDHRMYALNSYYGAEHAAFKEHNEKTAEELSGTHKGGQLLYRIHPEVYNDNRKTLDALHPHVSSDNIDHYVSQELDKVKKRSNDDIFDIQNEPSYDLLSHLAGHRHISASTTNKMINHALAHINNSEYDNDDDGHPRNLLDVLLGADKNITSSHIDSMIAHPNGFVRSLLPQSNKLTNDHLHKLLKDEDTYTASSTLENPNIKQEHVLAALDNPRITETALKHHLMPQEKLKEAIEGKNDFDYSDAAAAAQNPNISTENLAKARAHKNIFVRYEGYMHPKTTADELLDGIKDPSLDNDTKTSIAIHRAHDLDGRHLKALYDIDHRAINETILSHPLLPKDVKEEVFRNRVPHEMRSLAVNPSLTPEEIDQGLNSRNAGTRAIFASHKNASSENIHKALSDPDLDVAVAGTRNKNSQPEHLRRAIMHDNGAVRGAAYYHPNADLSVKALAKKSDGFYDDQVNFKSSNTIKIITEELTSEQKERVFKWPRDPEAIKHTDHYFGVGNDEKIEHLPETMDKSEIHKRVEEHLGMKIDPMHYKDGHTFDKYNRKVRIGALLHKTKAAESLKNDFANDSTRQGKNFTGLHVLTTRTPHGVAGQTSSGQSWEQQSCKNFNTGKNRHYLQPEVEHGTVVSYLRDHSGKELSRTTFQPHINAQGNRMYRIDSNYGINNKAFNEHNKKTELELSRSKDGNIYYKKHPEVYNDNEKQYDIHPAATLEDLEKAFNDKKTPDYIYRHLVTHKNFSDSNLIDHALDYKNGPLANLPEDRRDLLRLNNHVNIKHIEKAADDPFHQVRQIVARHSEVTPKILEKLMMERNDLTKNQKYENLNVQEDVVRSPNATKEQLERWSNHENPWIRGKLASNKKNDREFIDNLIKKENHPHALTWMSNKDVDLNDNNIREILRKKPIEERWQFNNMVKYIAAQHPNTSNELIEEMLHSNDKYIKRGLACNNKLSDNHIDHLINDSDNETLENLIKRNNNVKRYHLKKLTKHKSEKIQKLANSKLNALDNPNTEVSSHNDDSI